MPTFFVYEAYTGLYYMFGVRLHVLKINGCKFPTRSCNHIIITDNFFQIGKKGFTEETLVTFLRNITSGNLQVGRLKSSVTVVYMQAAITATVLFLLPPHKTFSLFSLQYHKSQQIIANTIHKEIFAMWKFHQCMSLAKNFLASEISLH